VQAQEPTCNAIITSVSPIIPNQHQTITISGSCFGNQMPYTNQDYPFITIQDTTQNWNAGNTNNGITLDVSSWTDSQISVTGFSGSYGNGNWLLHYGDTINIFVGNPQKTTGSQAMYTTTVAMDVNTSPTMALNPALIKGMSVQASGGCNAPNKESKVTIDWGDGIVTNGWIEYIHTYSQPGTYIIKVACYDINGLSGSATETINLQQGGQTTKQCPDGTVIPITSTCPTQSTGTKQCPDGTVIPITSTCPTQSTGTKQCPDGTVIPITSTCPTPKTPTAPSAPTDFAANIVANHIYLSWKPSVSNGGSDITEYVIMRDTTPNPQKILNTVTGIINSYDDNDVSPNQQYYYQIIAGNSVGQSDPASTSIVSPNFTTTPWFEEPPFLASTILAVVIGIAVPVIIQKRKKQR
jgi:hypothetical protein